MLQASHPKFSPVRWYRRMRLKNLKHSPPEFAARELQQTHRRYRRQYRYRLSLSQAPFVRQREVPLGPASSEKNTVAKCRGRKRRRRVARLGDLAISSQNQYELTLPLCSNFINLRAFKDRLLDCATCIFLSRC